MKVKYKLAAYAFFAFNEALVTWEALQSSW